ncbi:P-selectin glycoprotein ligand 1 [Pseudophryne corroboree]|uniref:P-selectin glycoprotein ligand 1 n=1 Tax=Pseudophryne corroboree TaxID=495146 RepID=UPI00308148E3
MSPPSTKLLLIYTSFLAATAYKLPLMDESPLADHMDKLLKRSNSSPLGINYQLNWATSDILDDASPIFFRMKREMNDATSTISSESTSESPLQEFSDSTAHILEAVSTLLDETQTMALLSRDDTTPFMDIEQTTKEAGEKLGEVETTRLDKLVTEVRKPSTTDSTLIPTTSEELSIFTSSKPNKGTTVIQIHSTDMQHTSSIQTSTSQKLSEDTPFTPVMHLNDITTEHNSTIGWIPVSSGSSQAIVTQPRMTTSSEDKIHTQSLMKQCMITILILAVVCTVFIVTTIALAAKISSLKQKQKRYTASYTEMRCISSLLPDSDQQGKAKPKKLKTFGANIEENDDDNTTLNSFLPE